MKLPKKVWKNPKLQRLWEITKRHYASSDFSMTSIVAAYYFLLSLFPLTITVGNILPYLDVDIPVFFHYLEKLVPADVYGILKKIITELLTKKSTGLLSISAIITLWSASKGINALQQGINRAYGINNTRNLVQSRIISFFVLVILIFVSIVAVMVLSFGREIIQYLQNKFKIDLVFLENIHDLTLVSLVIIVFLILFILYYAVSNVVIKCKRYLLLGTFVATIGLLILSQIFGLYAKYFTSISEYKFLGSFIVLMFWLVYSAQIVILGSIINSIVIEYFSGVSLIARKQLVYSWVKNKTNQEIDKLHKKKSNPCILHNNALNKKIFKKFAYFI